MKRLGSSARAVLSRCMLCGRGARAALLAVLAAGPAAALTPNLRIEADIPVTHFGETLASAGDVNLDGIEDLLVGAPYYSNGQLNEGAVFLFLGKPEGLTSGDLALADARIEGNQATARLGSALASAGDVDGDGYGDVIVGAGGWTEGQEDEGAAFVILGGPSGLPTGDVDVVASAKLQGDRVNARLGTSVAGADVNGDGYGDVISGGRLYQSSDLLTTREGFALIFLGGENGIASGNRLTADAVIESNRCGAELGISVAGVGDVNDDTFEDVLIGAPYWTGAWEICPAEGTPNPPEVREGAALLYLGSASGIPSGDWTTADAVIEGNQTNARLGRSVVGAGDLNGDEYDDVAIGASLYDAGQVDEGAVFLYHGGPDGITATGAEQAVARLEGDQVDVNPNPTLEREHFGLALAGGDWDDDGNRDLLVSSAYYNAGQTDEGAAFLFRGSASGIASRGAGDADRLLEANLRNGWIGAAVALVDVDDDGRADAFVGAPRVGYPLFGNPGETDPDEGMVFGFPSITACENGLDDDGDTEIDLLDLGCVGAEDQREDTDYASGTVNTITSAAPDTVVARDGAQGAPTSVVLDVGGASPGDLVAIEHSVVLLTGGTVSGDVVASDEGRAEIASGSVGGAVRATGDGLAVLRGGSVVALEARDTARIEIYGLAFALPNGDVAALSGTIEGTLEDGTPIAAAFVRDASATIHLVPEPAATSLAVASLASLVALRRRRS